MSTNDIQDTSSSFDFLKNLIKETSAKLHIKTGSVVDFNKVKDKENTESKDTVQEIKEEFDVDNIKPLNPRELGYQDFEEDVEKEKVGVNSLINASKKLLAINQGLTEPDERDSLVNVRVLNVDDLIDERVRLDAGKLRNALLFKLSKARSLKNLMSGFFDSYATGHIVGNPLSAPSEEINPLMISEQATRITKFGPGGIGSLDALTAESQNVHPSQFGFIDIISTPECLVYDPNYQVLTKEGFKSIADITIDSEIACSINNTLEFHKPEKVIRQVYSGDIYGIKNEYLQQEVTPNHRIYFRNSIDNTWEISEMKQLYKQEFKLCVNKENSKSISDLDIEVKEYNQYKYSYTGDVWCLQVPGSLFYVRYGDGGTAYWTGNSAKAGADVRMTQNARLGKKDGKLYTRVRERKTGKLVWMTPEEMGQHIIGIPK